jgi:hypothetical protein
MTDENEPHVLRRANSCIFIDVDNTVNGGEYTQEKTYRFSWWVRHLTQRLAIPGEINLVMFHDDFRFNLFDGATPTAIQYRNKIMYEISVKFGEDFRRENYFDPIYLLPIDDSQMQCLTFYLARYITQAFPRPVPKLAPLLYLPRLSEDAALTDYKGGRYGFIDRKIIDALIAAYQKRHITTRLELYEYIDTLTTFDALFSDGLFEAMQIAVYGLINPTLDDYESFSY